MRHAVTGLGGSVLILFHSQRSKARTAGRGRSRREPYHVVRHREWSVLTAKAIVPKVDPTILERSPDELRTLLPN